MIAFFGGPAGAGKSTLARAWADSRARAVHIEHDAIGNLICSGKADFQSGTPEVALQVDVVSRACCALAKTFYQAGFDVAVDHVFYPGEFEHAWKPHLSQCRCGIVIIRPNLLTTLARAAGRAKKVREDIIRDQHEKMAAWPAEFIVDSTDLSPEDCAKRVQAILAKTRRSE